MKRAFTLAATLVVMLIAVRIGAQLKPTDERVPCRDYKDVFALFDRLGYTQKAWQAGIREVPRVYLEDIPDRWREKGSKAMPVADKKRLFFRLIAPIVLRINELIAADRARAKVITEKLLIGEGVTPEDQAWLAELAVQYKVIGSPDDRLDSDQYPELLLRVDIVPASLSLAQAASESGWGTSRRATRCSASGAGARGSSRPSSGRRRSETTGSLPSAAPERLRTPTPATSTRRMPIATFASSAPSCGGGICWFQARCWWRRSSATRSAARPTWRTSRGSSARTGSPMRTTRTCATCR
jgi:hypothetical protein